MRMNDRSNIKKNPEKLAKKYDGLPLDLWQRLYDRADQIKTLAPWEWMDEEDYFGVQLPGNEPVRLVSFLGGWGEYFACAIYEGWESLRDIRAVQDMDDPSPMMTVMEIRHIQAVFTEREFVDESVAGVISALGRKYRGPNDWPVFQSYRAGYLPWRIEADEAPALLEVLNQALGMALRTEDHPELLRGGEEGQILFRVADATCGWRDEWRAMPELPVREMAVDLPVATLTALRSMPLMAVQVEMDFVMTAGHVQQTPDDRPESMYALTMVNADSGVVYGIEVMQALDGLDAMWAKIPVKVLTLLQRLGGCPKQVAVRSDPMMNLLRPLTEWLPFRLVRQEKLPRTEAIMEDLDAFLSKSSQPSGNTKKSARRKKPSPPTSDSSALP